MSIWSRFFRAAVSPQPTVGSTSPLAIDGIHRFWQFWGSHQADLMRAIETGTLQDWNRQVGAAVEGVHPDLGWEFGKGKTAEHYFCVSAGGNMSLRLIAERWLQRSPGTSQSWEFYPAKPPSPGITKTSIGDRELLFDDVRVSCTRAGYRLVLDVEVYHPSWSALSETDRATAGFVFLDSTLGEDDVSRWLGSIDMVTVAPEGGGIILADLRERVAELAATIETGVILEAKTDQGDVIIASVECSVKRIDHLGMDTHLEVEIPFDSTRDDGLCDQAASGELNRMEDELLDILGPDAVFAGRRTFGGLRTVHLRVASQGTAGARAEAWAKRQHREIEVTARLDPEWTTMPW